VWPGAAMIKYVVKADLASFYDYVDHEILGRELLIRTGTTPPSSVSDKPSIPSYGRRRPSSWPGRT
jgi:hypothetical protein